MTVINWGDFWALMGVAFALVAVGICISQVIRHYAESRRQQLDMADVRLYLEVTSTLKDEDIVVHGRAYDAPILFRMDKRGMWFFSISSTRDLREPVRFDRPIASSECPPDVNVGDALLLARALCEVYLRPKEE